MPATAYDGASFATLDAPYRLLPGDAGTSVVREAPAEAVVDARKGSRDVSTRWPRRKRWVPRRVDRGRSAPGRGLAEPTSQTATTSSQRPLDLATAFPSCPGVVENTHTVDHGAKPHNATFYLAKKSVAVAAAGASEHSAT